MSIFDQAREIVRNLQAKASSLVPSSSDTFDYRSSPKPNVIGTPSQMKLTVNSKVKPPKSTPYVAPAASPPVAQKDGFVFDFSKAKRDEAFPPTIGRGIFKPQQPPEEIGKLIRELFPQEATAAALVAANENARYNSNVPDNINANGLGVDRGIFQINDQTFNGLKQRRGNELKKLGISSFDEMRDPRKNAQVAKMIKDEGGWGRWFGWQDNGYDINGNMYSAPKRAAYEVAKLKRKKK